jgi:hypothetical protein
MTTEVERDYRNPHEKPPATASVFKRAAWFLADYAELVWDIGGVGDPIEDAENADRCAEMAELARRLRELDGEWEAKREASTNKSAAEIVADMLRDWKLPGAVWYSPARKRWRVTGENYRAEDGEVCVGVYAPDVPIALLQEDFDATEAA